LHAGLDVDAPRPLEVDDVSRVLHRGVDILASCSANDLVERVKHDEDTDLGKARVRA
jgi:hypothetical protein